MMKPETAAKLRQLAAVTRAKCETCPSKMEMKPTRCCDKFFCEVAAVTSRELGGGEPKRTKHPELPYMGEGGCTIPPQYRPVCSGYICAHHLKSRAFRREYERIHTAITEDPNVRRAVEKAKEEVGGLSEAIKRYREEHPLIFEEKPE